VKKPRTTNPELMDLIRVLRKHGREDKAAIWLDISKRLTKSHRQRVAVNVSHLSRYTQKNEIIAVPGKVLGTGIIDHALTVAALSFSKKAREKINSANGRCLSFLEVIKKSPKGSDVKIIG
jgi:large subunit ribosomal protein L18e